MRQNKSRILLTGIVCFALPFHPANIGANGLPRPAAQPDRLGRIDFPTSCTADVQPAIEKGVALLHSFQYTESEKAFADAATRDPKCAMAHWGKAMARFHQLWDFPNDQTLKEGRKDIGKAQKLHPANPREQGFIDAAAAFFQKKSKMTHVHRTQAYSTALEHFYTANPGDAEIGSFYALSLVSLAEQDSDTTANLQKGISILEPLLEQHPDHPGVAHYLIHAADRPEFAAQGLDAARRYAAIAPDSAHALHMPSHIFVRLGLWQDSITSNIAATASAAHAAEMHTAESHYQTHAMDFLSYSYLQSGQEAKAREVIEHTGHVIGATEEQKADHRAYFAARTALELHRWKEAAAWLAFAKGKSDEALAELRAAADHQDKSSGESVGIPAREMLADMLLELKRPAEAIAEYKTDLENSPNRFDALLGAARSAQASDDTGGAQSFYAKLAEICGAGADRPELAEVKTYLAQK